MFAVLWPAFFLLVGMLVVGQLEKKKVTKEIRLVKVTQFASLSLSLSHTHTYTHTHTHTHTYIHSETYMF